MPVECFEEHETLAFSPEGTGLTIRQLDDWAERLVQTVEAYRDQARTCRALNDQRAADADAT